MREQLVEAIQDAIAASKPSPSNEQEACFRIIDPLLRSMGYGLLDIKIQDRDKAGEKPDYSILPNASEHTWFLEAKAWNISLKDDHANQEVNYANTQGKRWVVLTNGHEWRLYDNHVRRTVKEKFACAAKLGDETFAGLIEALSKVSVRQSKPEDYVRNERLYSFLGDQIASPESETIRAIARIVRSVPELASVTTGEIVGFLRDYAPVPTMNAPSVGVAKVVASSPAEHPTPDIVTALEPVAHARPLGTLSSSAATGTELRSLILPDGQTVAVGTWRMLTLHATSFAMSNGNGLSLPFYLGARAKSPLIARIGSPESERMREPMRLSSPHDGWLVEGNLSANNHQSAALSVLRAAGIEPGTFQIVL